jgi:hypothetical protein
MYVGFKPTHMLYNSEGQNQTLVLLGQFKVSQSWFFSRGFRRELISLPFLQSRDHLHSLAHSFLLLSPKRKPETVDQVFFNVQSFWSS